MMKFKVGDKVRIKDNLGVLANGDMICYQGRETVVTGLRLKTAHEKDSYGLKIDNQWNHWTDEMLELVDEKKNNFIVRCLESHKEVMTKDRLYEFKNGIFKNDRGMSSKYYNSFEGFKAMCPHLKVELLEICKEQIDYKKIIEQQNKEIEKLKSIHDEQLDLLEKKRKDIEDLKEDREKLVSNDLHSLKKINEYLYEIGKLKKHIKKLYKHIDKLSPERMDL